MSLWPTDVLWSLQFLPLLSQAITSWATKSRRAMPHQYEQLLDLSFLLRLQACMFALRQAPVRSLSLQGCSPDPERKRGKNRWSGSLRDGGCRLERDPTSPLLTRQGTRRKVRIAQWYPQKPPGPCLALCRWQPGGCSARQPHCGAGDAPRGKGDTAITQRVPNLTEGQGREEGLNAFIRLMCCGILN